MDKKSLSKAGGQQRSSKSSTGATERRHTGTSSNMPSFIGSNQYVTHNTVPIGNVTVIPTESIVNSPSGNYGYNPNGGLIGTPASYPTTSSNRSYVGAAMAQSSLQCAGSGSVGGGGGGGGGATDGAARGGGSHHGHQQRIGGGGVSAASSTATKTSHYSAHHHSSSHHHHSSSHHHNNNNNNNNNTNNNNNHISSSTKMNTSHHSNNNNNHNNNNNNVSNHNNNNKVVNQCGPLKTTGCVTLDHMGVTNQTKTAVTARSKNEEAIQDLRTRIPEIENIFDVQSRIGNGTFSTVLLGTLKKERELPEALKRKFAIKHHIPTSHPDRIMKELQCMAKIGGTDNVVGINCCIRYNESVAFIMPYMPHDRFHDFFNKMDLSEMQFYMKNLLVALRHVHKFNVIHRDVKPSNFLYNRRKREFLLVDFGLAQQVPTPQSQICAANATNQTLAYKSNASTSTEGGGGKRLRDTTDGDLTAKRQKYSSGPHGDHHHQHQHATTSGHPHARVANSCIVPHTQSPFKMPLKQLNEINGKNGHVLLDNGTLGAAGVPSGTTGGAAATGICDSPAGGRQVRSTMGVVGVGAGGGRAKGGQAPATPAANKYNTNRNGGTAANDTKCYCYGKPQVCNMCLVKKEIHASRAGTPGYRPPEVLLKYPDQTTAVDIWAAGVIFLSILSSVYPFFKAPNDFVALAEMVTIFGDKTIRKTAFVLDRLLTLSQKTKPLDLRKLCVRFRNRAKFSSPELLRKHQDDQGQCEVCKNCDQFYFNCLCLDTQYKTEPLDQDDPFPDSAYDLLYRLLEVNPHERITAEQALNHPFFTDPWQKAKTTTTTPLPASVELATGKPAGNAATTN